MASTSRGAEWTYSPLQAEMQIRVLLLLMMMMLAHGEKISCKAIQNTTCRGEAGQPVYLQLITDTKGRELKLYIGNKNIFQFKKNKTAFYNEFNTTSVLQRWHFVPDNGTMIIKPARSTDSGTYTVDIHNNSAGTSVGVHMVQLIIKDHLLLPVLVSLGVILMCVCVAAGVFYILKRRNAVKPDTQEELHYAVVSVLNINEKRQEARAPEPPNESVYAQVQPGQ